MSLSPSSALIGAPYENSYGAIAGAAYLFDLTTGRLQFELQPEERNPEEGVRVPDGGSKFGFAVALPTGDHSADSALDLVLVGAPSSYTTCVKAGAAYLFSAVTGAQTAKLIASDCTGTDEFGYSVAIHAGLAIIGARLHQNGGTSSGAIYVFDCGTGVQQRKIVPSRLESLAMFGASVAAHSGLMLVGSPKEDTTAVDSGAVYVYDVVSGDLRRKLVPPSATINSRFGASVATFNGAAIVGSPMHTAWRGAAHLFADATSSAGPTELAALGLMAGDAYGSSVALGADVAIVGAPSARSQNGAGSGYAILFHGIGGNSSARRVLTSWDGDADDNFGVSAAILGDSMLLGAQGHVNSEGSLLNGAAYLFRPAPSPPPPVTPPPPPPSPPNPELFASPASPPASSDTYFIFVAIGAASIIVLLTVSLTCFFARTYRERLKDAHARFSKRWVRTLPGYQGPVVRDAGVSQVARARPGQMQRVQSRTWHGGRLVEVRQ